MRRSETNQKYINKIKEEFKDYLENIDPFEVGEDGCGVYLKEEYLAKSTQAHCVHENTIRQCYIALCEGIIKA